MRSGRGSRVVVLDGDLSAARDAVDGVLADADLAYSRFRPDSELTGVNARAGRTVTVSATLARAIEGALDAARRTGGAVDPTVGRAMRLIGYDRDFDLFAGSSRPLELLIEPVPGWSVVSFDARQPLGPRAAAASSSISGPPARASPPIARPRPPSPRPAREPASSSAWAGTSRPRAGLPTVAGGSSSSRTAERPPTASAS